MLVAMTFALLATAPPTATLEGLWTAQREYAPAVSAGSHVRLRSAPAAVLQWIQPGDEENSSPLAIPVPLSASREDRRGTVEPMTDVQHLLLYIQAAPDGTLQAFVRNPEQNIGGSIGGRRVTRDGDRIALQRTGSPDIAGTWREREPDTLTLESPGLPGTFVFARATPSPAPTPYAYRTPHQRGDGWTVGSLTAQGFDESAVASIVDDVLKTKPALRAPYLQGLLVARHGTLVLDEYFNGFDADRPHDVRSAGKSVTTLLVGRAIEDGARFTPATPIARLLSSYGPFAHDDGRKRAITIGDLMSMSAGYACDDNDDASPGNEDRMQSQTAQPNWYRYTLDLPMLFAPGTQALYCTAEINVLGAVISKETGWWLPDYFYDRFARKMQFGRYGMWLTPAPVDDAYMGGGDVFLPRDFLKFGQLFLDGGRWHGTQVIDPAWLREIATKHSYIKDGGGDYGYGWHLATYQYHGRAIHAIYASGNGGQLLYVFPDLDLVVMITSANYNQFPVWHTYQTDLIPKILAALKRRPA